MQDISLHLNWIGNIIFIGIFLGLFISYFLLIKSWKTNLSNFLMGLFILAMSLAMLEGWLNYTGYIFKFLWATNFAEPMNFIIAPLIYLFVISQFKDFKRKQMWIHFIPFILWAGYCIFFFIQSNEFKYNSNLEVMSLELAFVHSNQKFSADPFKIRAYVNLLTGASFIIYNFLIIGVLFKKSRELGESIFKTSNKTLISLRNSLLHFLVIVVIFIFVKLLFKNDVGDYFIFLYLSFMILITTFHMMNDSNYYDRTSTFLEIPSLKYKKSSLLDAQKEGIMESIKQKMEMEKYFIQGIASLSGLAKSINASPHHVSQVINEKMNQSFFEMLATYRIEEAKIILKSEIGKKLTIEEVAEQVGYNSKSAFNTSFKKITSQTPSSFRDS